MRGNTNVVLEKEGYVKQALMITPDSEPNLVVTLVPSGEGGGDDEVEAAEADGPTAVAKKGKGKKGKSGEEAEGDGEATSAATEPAAAETQPSLTKPEGVQPETKPKKVEIKST